MTTLRSARQYGRSPAVVSGVWPRHPVDPLCADEIGGAVDVLPPLQRLDECARFVAAHVQELPTDTVLTVADVGVVPREASPSRCPRGRARKSRRVPDEQPAIVPSPGDLNSLAPSPGASRL